MQNDVIEITSQDRQNMKCLHREHEKATFLVFNRVMKREILFFIFYDVVKNMTALAI